LRAYPLTTRQYPEPSALKNGEQIQATSRRQLLRVATFFAAHALLGLMIYRYKSLATLHAFVTLALGLRWALAGRKQLHRVAYVGAYIVGAEVLWRMSNAVVFYEIGKYGVAAIFIVSLLRNRQLKGPALPLVYFLLLLPSAALTISENDWTDARMMLSFNLAGPLALMVSTWFFSHIKLSQEQLQSLFLTLVCPLISVASVTLFGTISNSDIRFTGESNLATSGGFGPNQVSASLGLGVFVALFCILRFKISSGLKILLFGAMCFLAVQSALTFSRGGLYNAAGAILIGSFYLLRDARARIQFILAAVLILAAVFIILPRLDNFTGGTLSSRFEDASLTNRGDIIWLDLQIWADHPILGVGPGLAKEYRQDLGLRASAHTEFTRLLAEHGTLGFAAILALIFTIVSNMKRVRTVKDKATVAATMGWSLLFMLNAGMRLVAPAFIFGLSFTNLVPAKNPRNR
jgi:O-antigen ligase